MGFGFNAYNSYLDIDDCANEPCKNGGICTDGIAKYSCKCAEGFSGTDCSKSKFFRYLKSIKE